MIVFLLDCGACGVSMLILYYIYYVGGANPSGFKNRSKRRRAATVDATATADATTITLTDLLKGIRAYY